MALYPSCTRANAALAGQQCHRLFSLSLPDSANGSSTVAVITSVLDLHLAGPLSWLHDDGVNFTDEQR